ncbi:MAG: galactokinase [Myxococcota bacterium]|nr:galactokinase [Myxococcota bacterium]
MDDPSIEAFAAAFGRRPEVAVAAPGRVNLIGEHTDYNEGLVLPCAIDRRTRVLAAPRSDGLVRAVSEGQDGRIEMDLARPERRGDWGDYVLGPLLAIQSRGLASTGLDLHVDSDLPRESGLSSSAALGVSVAGAAAAAHGLDLGPRDWAELAHHGEHHHVGVACGIMDQFASALSRRDHVLRIDCRTREVEPVPFAARAALLIAQSGVVRRLAEGGYVARVEECRAALKGAQKAGVAPAEATSLRALGVDDLPALERALPDVPLRRARHVLTENARVEATCAALRAGDLPRVGELLKQGMASLRDDFEVSVPELDVLCRLGDAAPGCFGSRLTGAGWGGCTLHLVEPDAAGSVAEAIAAGFEREVGRRPVVLEVAPAEGARILPL